MVNEFNWMTKNFWNEYPEIKAHDKFLEYYEKDLSPNKETSSRVLWALAMCLEKESPLFNASDKFDAIKATILKGMDFSWSSKEISSLRASYEDLCTSPEEKSYLQMLAHMRERDNYIKNFKYSGAEATEIKTVESMIGNTLKFHKELAQVKELLEAKSKTVRKPKSLSDQGLI